MSLSAIESHDSQRWHDLARTAQANLETRLFINGEFCDALEGGRFKTVNPATGQALAKMSKGMPEDVDRAVAAANWSRASFSAQIRQCVRAAAGPGPAG